MRKEPFRKRMEFLGPLDNALWDRRLIEALFDFQYKWRFTRRRYSVSMTVMCCRCYGALGLSAGSR